MNILKVLRKRAFPICLSIALAIFSQAELNAAQLLLSWTDNSTNEDGFKIERGPATAGPFTQIGTTLSNTASYTDSGLADATTFCYRVRAYNTAGDSGYTNAVCGTTTATMTLTKAGTGSGTVTSVPAGINCGATCSFSYTSGTSVTLTAAAAAGSTFTGWTGVCTGTGACVVTMDAAKSVSAAFTILPPTAPSALSIL